jgi:hypothetical protein
VDAGHRVTLLTRNTSFIVIRKWPEKPLKKRYDLLITSGDWDLAKQQGRLRTSLFRKSQRSSSAL